MFGLTEKELNILKNNFAKYDSIKKVILYGSRAIGNYKKGSDIDITLIGDKKLKKDIFYLHEDLEENLPYFVDISIFNEIENEKLKEHINRFGKIIYHK